MSYGILLEFFPCHQPQAIDKSEFIDSNAAITAGQRVCAEVQVLYL